MHVMVTMSHHVTREAALQFVQASLSLSLSHTHTHCLVMATVHLSCLFFSRTSSLLYITLFSELYLRLFLIVT
jgi:hypothetical protein